jgi:hypothetical protein
MKKPNRWQAAGIATALVAATGVLALTGTFNHTATTRALPSPGTTPTTPSFSKTIAATPRPEAAGIKAGDKLTTSPGVLAGSLLTYPLEDGTYVVVDATKDLPANVLTSLKDEGAAALGGNLGPKLGAAAKTLAYGQFAEYAHATTGKWVVLVAPEAAPSQWSFWAHDGAGDHHSEPDTLKHATDDATAWVAGHENAMLLVESGPSTLEGK